MHKFLYLVCLIIFQSGCASVISDESQPITFLSVCGTKTVSDAECFLKNSDGDYYVKTPGTIMINKSFGDLSITCTKNNVSISESQSSKTGLLEEISCPSILETFSKILLFLIRLNMDKLAKKSLYT